MATTKLFTIEDLNDLDSEWYELIRGELRDVSPSFSESSGIAAVILSPLVQFVRLHRLGVVFGADGGFALSRNPDTLVAPDVSFVRRDRIPPNHDFRSFFPGPPDLAVEVFSASQRPGEIAEKIELYRDAGVPLLWEVRPSRQTVTVYRPGRDPVTLGIGDVLDGEDVVPGFRLAIAEVFELIP